MSIWVGGCNSRFEEALTPNPFVLQAVLDHPLPGAAVHCIRKRATWPNRMLSASWTQNERASIISVHPLYVFPSRNSTRTQKIKDSNSRRVPYNILKCGGVRSRYRLGPLGAVLVHVPRCLNFAAIDIIGPSSSALKGTSTSCNKGTMPSRGGRGRQKQRVLSKPRYQGPIPRCEGPKLSPFRDRKAAIEFVRLLSDPELEGQAYVFEVLIASKPYALKVVCPSLYNVL